MEELSASSSSSHLSDTCNNENVGESGRIQSFRESGNWQQTQNKPRGLQAVGKMPSLVRKRGDTEPGTVWVTNEESLSPNTAKQEYSRHKNFKQRTSRNSRIKPTNNSWQRQSSKSRSPTHTVNMATGKVESPSPLIPKTERAKSYKGFQPSPPLNESRDEKTKTRRSKNSASKSPLRDEIQQYLGSSTSTSNSPKRDDKTSYHRSQRATLPGARAASNEETDKKKLTSNRTSSHHSPISTARPGMVMENAPRNAKEFLRSTISSRRSAPRSSVSRSPARMDNASSSQRKSSYISNHQSFQIAHNDPTSSRQPAPKTTNNIEFGSLHQERTLPFSPSQDQMETRSDSSTTEGQAEDIEVPAVLAPVSPVVKTETINESVGCYRTRRKGILLVIIVLVLFAGIAIGVVVPKPREKNSMEDSVESKPMPTSAPTSMERLKDIMTVLESISSKESLEDVASPQRQALEWLSFSDEAQLSPLDTSIKERYLLALLYFTWGGNYWFDSTDFLSGKNACFWKGVTCNNDAVIAIQLPRNNVMGGSIPIEICDFDSLRHLDLTGNHIGGPIPKEIEECKNLVAFSVAGNSISGSIPTELGGCTNLVELRLDLNEFIGTLPTTIGLLSNLEYVSLSKNVITGNLPSEMGNLRNLKSLVMASCKLDTLPNELENLLLLHQIDLGDNLLSGNIPSSLGALTKLTELRLENNRFQSSIPTILGNLVDLKILRLDNNDLSGSIPESFGKLVNLSDAQFQSNDLEGDIDPIFCTHEEQDIETLISDCSGFSPAISCSCCSSCWS